jgi:hypothetical protein
MEMMSMREHCGDFARNWLVWFRAFFRLVTVGAMLSTRDGQNAFACGRAQLERTGFRDGRTHAATCGFAPFDHLDVELNFGSLGGKGCQKRISGLDTACRLLVILCFYVT